MAEPGVLAATTPVVTVAVGPSAGNAPVQEVTTFGSVGVTLDFQRGDQVQFTCSGRSAEAAQIDELATDVWLSGSYAQRFRVTQVNQEWDADGDDTLSVLAVSYKRLLNARHVGPGGLVFAGVDQGEIIWGLVAHTQARVGGNWGITKGVVATGQLRDRTYVEGDNLGDLAEKLQNVDNGLWWEVNASKVLSAKLQSTFPVKATPLQLGTTVRSMQRGSNADSFANAVYGDASEGLTPVWVEAAGLATDPRGRWERAFGWPTVTEQTTLQQHTQGALATANSPLSAWRIDLEPSRFTADVAFLPGDFSTLVIPPTTAAPIGPGGAVRTVTVQVSQASISINADGGVTLTMAVVEVA